MPRRFDFKFLRHKLASAGEAVQGDWRYLDTLLWARKLDVCEHKSQEGLRAHFGVDPAGQAHRAGSDVRVLAEVVVKMMDPDVCGKDSFREVLSSPESFTGMFNDVVSKRKDGDGKGKERSENAVARPIKEQAASPERAEGSGWSGAEDDVSAGGRGARWSARVEASGGTAPPSSLSSDWEVDPLTLVEGAMKADDSGGVKWEEGAAEGAVGGVAGAQGPMCRNAVVIY